jgi:hypothetical protein
MMSQIERGKMSQETLNTQEAQLVKLAWMKKIYIREAQRINKYFF